MSSLLNILLRVFQFLEVVAVALGLYGWFAMSPFLEGEITAPYWLVSLYDQAMPLLMGTAATGIVVSWGYKFLIGLFGQKPLDIVGTLTTALWTLIGLSLVGSVPVLTSSYTHLQQYPFGTGTYQLFMHTNTRSTSYVVVECSDPAGIWCQQITTVGPFNPPPPTPLPLENDVAVIQGQRVIIPPPVLPTSTPPAELVADTTEQHLGLKIGTSYIQVATPQPTVAPAEE